MIKNKINKINRMNKTGAFVDYPVNFLFVALFLIAIITFGTLLANEYGLDSEDIYGRSMGVDSLVSNLEGGINESHSDSLIMKNKTLEGEITTTSTIAILGGMLGTVWKSFGIIPRFFNLMLNLIKDVLGIPDVIIYGITAIFLIGVVFAIIRLIMTGK